MYRARHADEMCSMFVMYYTLNGESTFELCASQDDRHLIDFVPGDADVSLPENLYVEQYFGEKPNNGTTPS